MRDVVAPRTRCLLITLVMALMAHAPSVAVPVSAAASHAAAGNAPHSPSAKANIPRTYNGKGQIVRETRDQVTTTYEYDGDWLALQQTKDGSWSNTVTQKYDVTGLLLSKKESWNSQTGGAAGGAQNALSYTYTTTRTPNGKYRERTESITAIFGQQSHTVSNIGVVIDSLGNDIKRDVGGIVDYFVYDPASRLVYKDPAGLGFTKYIYQNGLLDHEDHCGFRKSCEAASFMTNAALFYASVCRI